MNIEEFIASHADSRGFVELGIHVSELREILKAYVLVPLEPTEEMLVAGQEEWAMGRRGALEDCKEAEAVYRAMISAAQAKEQGEGV